MNELMNSMSFLTLFSFSKYFTFLFKFLFKFDATAHNNFLTIMNIVETTSSEFQVLHFCLTLLQKNISSLAVI